MQMKLQNEWRTSTVSMWFFFWSEKYLCWSWDGSKYERIFRNSAACFILLPFPSLAP